MLGLPTVHSVRLHTGEQRVSTGLARQLIRTQFPQWRGMPIEPVASTGTDNVIYRLGDEMAIRFPRIDWAVGQIEKEQEWLPRLAPRLPVELPSALARGVPAAGYPWPWLVYRWLEGDSAPDVRAADQERLARDLACFLSALHGVDTAEVPAKRAADRGGPLEPNDKTMRAALEALRVEIDHDRALAVWESALDAPPWDGPPVWVHGDLLPGNVLLRGGRLAGVIDWAACGVGDPACDLMIAWALDRDARAALRDALALDEATWARGKGWTLLQAALFIPYYSDTIPEGVAAARQRLNAVLAD